MEVFELIKKNKDNINDNKDSIEEQYGDSIGNLRFQLALFDISSYLHSKVRK